MAKRRRKTQTTGVPPPPVIKAVKPNSHELKFIYKKFVSANISHRISAFTEALQWWDKAVNYHMVTGFKMSPDILKKFGQANKSRNLAIGAGTEQEREAAFIRAVALLEKVFGQFKIPSYKPYYDEYISKKEKLEERDAASNVKFQELLDAANQAFAPLGRSFELVKANTQGDLREYDGNGKIMLTTALAKSLKDKNRREGILPFLFSELFTVVKSYGIETVNDPASPGGVKTVPNFKKMLAAVPKALEGILAYIATQPRSRVFKQFDGQLEATATLSAPSAPKVFVPKPPRQANANAGPKTPRAPRQSGPLVGDRYQPGSAMAILYQRLMDQKTHSLTDVLKNLPVNNAKERLKYLVKHGDRNGKWSIVQQGNTIRMVIP